MCQPLKKSKSYTQMELRSVVPKFPYVAASPCKSVRASTLHLNLESGIVTTRHPNLATSLYKSFTDAKPAPRSEIEGRHANAPQPSHVSAQVPTDA